MDRPTRTDDARHLMGISWTADGPFIRLDDERVPAIGLELHVEVGTGRRCLGSTDHRDCRRVPDEPGEKRCTRCQIAEARHAAGLHHAHTRPRELLSADAVAHLDQPNLLYLAAFRDGSVKVGTSTSSRIEIRLAEQGAWQATIIGQFPDGFIVRRVEDAVTEVLDIGQSVSVSRKLSGLITPRPDAELGRILSDRAHSVGELLSVAGEPYEPVDETWHHPSADDPAWAAVDRYPLPVDEGIHHIVIEAACGRMLRIARPGHPEDRFVLDPAPMFGRALTPTDAPPPELAVQTSLF